MTYSPAQLFGHQLKKLRTEQKHHSLRSLGDTLGVSAKHLSEIENGLKLPNDELINRIAVEFEYDEVKLCAIAKTVPYAVKLAIENDERISRMVWLLVQTDKETFENVERLLLER